MHVNLICAGAAKGLVEALRHPFEGETGATIHATFGAVGAMREQLDAGAPCDVLVLTAGMQDALARDGRVMAATITPLGGVPTGIAVRTGELAAFRGKYGGYRQRTVCRRKPGQLPHRFVQRGELLGRCGLHDGRGK